MICMCWINFCRMPSHMSHRFVSTYSTPTVQYTYCQWSDCITSLMLSVCSCTIRCSNFWLFELTCLEVYFSLCEWQASPEHHGSWEDMLTSWLLMPWCSPPERQYYNLVPRQIHCVLWVVLSSKVAKQFMERRQITLETRLRAFIRFTCM